MVNRFALAARALARRPGFSLVAVGTIALAIAANTAMFSVVNGVLLHPLPFRDPDRLVTLNVRAPTGFLVSLSIPDYRDWRDKSRVIRSIGASAGWGFTLTGHGQAREIDARVVVGDFFRTLGLEPALGRLIALEEMPDHPGGAAVAVLGHQFWKEQLAGDSSVVGQALILDGDPYTVVGVLPPDVGWSNPGVSIYVPMSNFKLEWEVRGSGWGTRAVARLHPGVTMADAQRDLDRVGREVTAAVGKPVCLPEVVSLTRYLVGDVRAQIWLLMGAVALVLLIAVANVGNLLLARGESRQVELSIRTALGADRRDIVALLLSEALVVSIVGGALGVGAAFLAVKGLVPLLPAAVPAVLVSRIRVDGTVMVVAIGLALGAGLLFGLAPAFRSAGLGVTGAMKSGTRVTDPGGGRLRGGLVVAEIALALVLLVSAGLMLSSLDRLRKVDKGFDSNRVLTAALSPPRRRFASKPEWLAFHDQVRQRVARLPGVKSAAYAVLIPLGNRSWERGIHPDGVPVRDETAQSVLWNIVSPEYFQTMGVTMVKGRGFGIEDRDGGTLVAVIDETMGQRFWPGQDPLGKRVTVEQDSAGVPLYRTVIGVAGNVRHYELTNASRIQLYLPLAQTGDQWGMGLRLIVKTEGPPHRLADPIRATVAEIDPDTPVSDIQSLDQVVDGAMGQSRAVTGVLTAFGGAALALAALGIFGVMSYLVARRTREIGIRIALGAAARDVVWWVGGRAFRLTAFGLALGSLGALAATRLLRGILFEVSPLDPLIFTGGAVVLAAVALLAAYLPARRATRVDPATVLNEAQ